MTFKVNPSAQTIDVEFGIGTDKSAFHFEYTNSYGLPHLVGASMIETFYDAGQKRMRSMEFAGVKGNKSSIPWPCPMTIRPIYAP